MRVMSYALGLLVIGIGGLLHSTVFSGMTGSLGSSPGGPLASSFDLNCPNASLGEDRVTGVEVTFSTTILRIRLKCRGGDASGNWMANSVSNTNWSPIVNLQVNPTPLTQSVECPANKFVAGFNAYTVGPVFNRSIKRVRIICSSTTFFGQSFPSTFEVREVGGQATGGAWNQSDLICPIASSANGVTGRFFASVRVLGFRCIDPAKATFAALLPTFRHPRCATCHGQKESSGLRPAGHPGTSVNNCAACHTTVQGWQMPPDTMRFDNTSNAQLCEMARNHPNPFNHLRDDQLVLWAVGNAAVPELDQMTPQTTKQLPKAPPFDIQTWRNGVTAWQNDVNGATPSQANPAPCGTASLQ